MKKVIAYSSKFGGFVYNGLQAPSSTDPKDIIQISLNAEDLSVCTVWVCGRDQEGVPTAFYTGFNDVDGKEIYEGMELIAELKKWQSYRGVVIFSGGSFCLRISAVIAVGEVCKYQCGEHIPLSSFRSYKLTGKNRFEHTAVASIYKLGLAEIAKSKK